MSLSIPLFIFETFQTSEMKLFCEKSYRLLITSFKYASALIVSHEKRVYFSYSYSVAAALKGVCQVQLAPMSKAGVALDSAYAVDCLDMFLSTKTLQPTRYDVILFNFGLHDIDYLKIYPEVNGCRQLSLYKIPKFHLIFCCAIFVEAHSFHRVLGHSPETLQK